MNTNREISQAWFYAVLCIGFVLSAIGTMLTFAAVCFLLYMVAA